jgi:acyl CoA:acetate/3-ketoacid CoA transferase
MYPVVWGDPLRFGQLDHVHRRLMIDAEGRACALKSRCAPEAIVATFEIHSVEYLYYDEFEPNRLDDAGS